MTYGLAERNTRHVLGDGNSGEFVPAYRVVASCILVKAFDGRGRNALHGDVLDWLSPEQKAHFLRHKLVEAIDAGSKNVTPEPDDDADAGPADSGAVAECADILDGLQVPTTAGAPACRTALRSNQYRYSNAVVAAAVKRRKGLSDNDADDEDFEAVVA